MAEVDSKTIEQFALSQFKGLPEYISEDNADMFENALYLIDKLCADNPNAYRLIMPFHHRASGSPRALARG